MASGRVFCVAIRFGFHDPHRKPLLGCVVCKPYSWNLIGEFRLVRAAGRIGDALRAARAFVAAFRRDAKVTH